MSLRVGLVVPHIFMHRDILPNVIFSPGQLALSLAESLAGQDIEVTLFTPGPMKGSFKSVTADLTYFEAELEQRGDSYLDLLKKHPFTFITLARQVQSEIVARAFAMANAGELDIIHIYANEEDISLPFTQFCRSPVLFTHHDPFNFLVKYRSVFPKYKHLNWLSISHSQRATMPTDTNWIGNIYHGVDSEAWQPNYNTKDYVAYLGRIIEPKGVHLAIAAVKKYNKQNPKQPLTLKIAGKHYAGDAKDGYWKNSIEPELQDPHIEYVGFISDQKKKQAFLGQAKALLMPSIWSEPFGMAMIEALACGTPIVGLDSGAIPEIIKDGENGFVIPKALAKKQPPDSKKTLLDEKIITQSMAQSLEKIETVSRKGCRKDFEDRFSLAKMAREHAELYRQIIGN